MLLSLFLRIRINPEMRDGVLQMRLIRRRIWIMVVRHGHYVAVVRRSCAVYDL
jgi:hypothetical protein